MSGGACRNSSQSSYQGQGAASHRALVRVPRRHKGNVRSCRRAVRPNRRDRAGQADSRIENAVGDDMPHTLRILTWSWRFWFSASSQNSLASVAFGAARGTIRRALCASTSWLSRPGRVFTSGQPRFLLKAGLAGPVADGVTMFRLTVAGSYGGAPGSAKASGHAPCT